MEPTTNNTKCPQTVKETLGSEKFIEDDDHKPGRDRERKVAATEIRHQEVEIHESQIDDPVRSFMMSLGIQDNVNLSPVRPGAVFVGGIESLSRRSIGVAGEVEVKEPAV